MKTDSFNYELPESLIASHPPEQRDGGRLMVIRLHDADNHHQRIRDLPAVLPSNALLVANDTRVFKARLFGARPTGGKVEVLLVRPAESGRGGCRFEALLQANRPIRVGDHIDIAGVGFDVAKRGHRGEAIIETPALLDDIWSLVREHGQVPLPPYIRRPVEPEDVERYQTVYASEEGSIAAPTAGLHFTPELLAEILERGVEVRFITLHVGPGTFRPIVAEYISDHVMDREAYSLGKETVEAIQRAKNEGRPVIVVGTTTCRALEGAFTAEGRLQASTGFTELFITPGFEFKVTDGLITNFHLPKSTLLLLVSALAGRRRILAAYREAVEKEYRFYSYGDAMLILGSEK